jgi:hypothetical protein
LRHSGRAVYLYSTALRTQLTTIYLEDFFLTSQFPDFLTQSVGGFINNILRELLLTSGFWPRVRAPVFFRLTNMQNGALRAPSRPSQLRCFLFTPQNFPSGPNSGSQGCVYLSIGSKLHPPELHCILLSYAGAP